MAGKNESVVVVQFENPKYVTATDTGGRYVYQVKTTTNTIRVALKQWLEDKEIQALINDGVNVKVVLPE